MTTGEKLFRESSSTQSWCSLSGPQRLEWIERGLAEGGPATSEGSTCATRRQHSSPGRKSPQS